MADHFSILHYAAQFFGVFYNYNFFHTDKHS